MGAITDTVSQRVSSLFTVRYVASFLTFHVRYPTSINKLWLKNRAMHFYNMYGIGDFIKLRAPPHLSYRAQFKRCMHEYGYQTFRSADVTALGVADPLKHAPPTCITMPDFAVIRWRGRG